MNKISNLNIGYLFFLFLLSSCSYDDQQAMQKNFKNQLGTYSLSIEKTNLGVYASDSQIYKQLKITFNSDSTFRLNMNVPFILDSAGKWIPAKGGPEEWNWLYYNSNPNISTQFTEPWGDSFVFLLNSATPKLGQERIKEIYFIKVVE